MKWKKFFVLAAASLVSLWWYQGTATASPQLKCPRHAWGCATPQEKASVKRAIRIEFGTGYLGRLMTCIAYHESGYNPYAANYGDANGGSYGWAQVNGIHRRWVDFDRINDPTYVAHVARRLMGNGSGRSNWTTASRC